MRTTLDIDEPILGDLRARAKAEKKSLGRMASELLARALKQETSGEERPRFDAWMARPMGAKVDLSDSEALYTVMDRPSVRVDEEM